MVFIAHYAEMTKVTGHLIVSQIGLPIKKNPEQNGEALRRIQGN